MPNYEYTAINAQKQPVKDAIMASSKEEAKQLLSAQGLQISSIKKAKGSGSLFKLPSASIPLIEKANLCRYLSTMIGSGISLPEAVQVYAQDTKNQRLKAILTKTEQQLQQGKTLSSAFEQYPQVFSNIVVALIRSGERSGTLNESLDYLSKYLFSDYKLRQKVKGALMYPIIIVLAMAGVGLMLMFFVIPRIAPVFLQLKVDLPLHTRIILQTGILISNNMIIVVPAMILGVISLVIILLRPTGRKIMLRVVSLIPAIKTLLSYLDLSRFCRTLSTLLSSGVPISEAMDIVTTTLSQTKYQKAVTTFSDELQKGTGLAQLMRNYPNLFPLMTVRMIAAGEHSGSIEDMLAESADYYENEVEDILNNFANIIEPILLLLVGIGVGFMVIAVVGPIYSLVGGIQNI